MIISIAGIIIGIAIGALAGLNQEFFNAYMLGWAATYVAVTIGGYV